MKMMHKQFSFELVKGNTNETLKDEAFDLVYLDGGHSIETIRNDFEKLKRSKIIVFDDYYLPDENGKCPDISKVGCNFLKDELKLMILPVVDRVKDGGMVAFAVYENRSN